MAGYVASNIVEGLVETVQWYEIDDIVANGGYLIDVRDPGEVARGALRVLLIFQLMIYVIV